MTLPAFLDMHIPDRQEGEGDVQASVMATYRPPHEADYGLVLSEAEFFVRFGVPY